MDFESFQESLQSDEPPEGISDLLAALWWDVKDEWEKAHEITQDIKTPDAAWVHAYLHRKEGDEWNAGYWYTNAGKPKYIESLEDEWTEIVKELLKKEA